MKIDMTNTVAQLAVNVIEAAKNGNVISHSIEGDIEKWTLNNVNDNNKGGVYQVHMITKKNRNGKTYYGYRLYRVLENDKIQNVNLGHFKKVFYSAVYGLKKNNFFHKIQQQPKVVNAWFKDMKYNPTNWSKPDADTIIGNYDGNDIKITRIPQLNKNGKVMYRVSATVNGEHAIKGSQLMLLYRR